MSGVEERRENSQSRELKSLYVIPQHKREMAKRVFLGNSEYRGTPKSLHVPPSGCLYPRTEGAGWTSWPTVSPGGDPRCPSERTSMVTVREQIKLTNDGEASYLSREIISLFFPRKVVSYFIKRQEVYRLHGEVIALHFLRAEALL